MKKMIARCTVALLGAGLCSIHSTAWADSCETAPGSGVYTDQCGPNAPANSGRTPPAAARPAAPAQPTADGAPAQGRPAPRARTARSAGGAGEQPARQAGSSNSGLSLREQLRNALSQRNDELANEGRPAESRAAESRPAEPPRTPEPRLAEQRPAEPPKSLRVQLQEYLANRGPAATWTPGDDIKAAQQRATDALSDPNSPDARQRYEAAMRDVNRAFQRAYDAAPPSERAQINSAMQRNEKNFSELAKQVNLGGLGSPDVAGTGGAPGAAGGGTAAYSTAPAADASPAATLATAPNTPALATTPPALDAAVNAAATDPKWPENIAVFGGNVYVCDGPAGGSSVSCRELSRNGTQCTGVILNDGVVGWHDSIPTPCSDNDLASRNAFVAAHETLLEKQEAFGMRGADTDAAIAKLIASVEPLDAVVNLLPAQCRADFSKYLQGVARSHGSLEFANWMMADHSKTFKEPSCSKALDELAEAVGFKPSPKADAADLASLDAALAGEPLPTANNMRLAQPMQAPPQQVASNYDNDDFTVDDALDVLSIGTSILSIAGSLFGGGGGSVNVPRAPRQRAPAVAPRRPDPPAAYPSPGGPTAGRGMDCTMSANNWLTCK